jgi:hypothetical protein
VVALGLAGNKRAKILSDVSATIAGNRSSRSRVESPDVIIAVCCLGEQTGVEE